MFQLLLTIIYMAFISLGLPDALLGAAWPKIYPEFQIPVSYAGIISMIIALGTIISSLQSDRLTRKLGTGKVTLFSVLLTAIALFGFSYANSFLLLCLWAIPYGLGAGSVDAALNNYVALHYKSRHMSWLHCMWGVGAATGPYIMGFAFTQGQHWTMGYFYIAILQVLLTTILFFSLPLWKKRKIDVQTEITTEILSLRNIITIPGNKEIMFTFFGYCALEQTAGLWASSYLVLHYQIAPETAASFAALFYLGITVGRAISGFLTFKLSDAKMIQLGFSLIILGILSILLPLNDYFALAGLVLIGLGGAPIYPCLIHSTPSYFGANRSQSIIGVQMAAAYIGTCAMPPLFGLIANHIDIALFPFFLLALLMLMGIMFERLEKKAG